MSYDTIKKRNERSGQAWAGQGAKHYCAVPGCGEMIPRRLLMCAVHWSRVPGSLKSAVYRTFKNGGAGAYLAAREAAIDSVTGGQS